MYCSKLQAFDKMRMQVSTTLLLFQIFLQGIFRVLDSLSFQKDLLGEKYLRLWAFIILLRFSKTCLIEQSTLRDYPCNK